MGTSSDRHTAVVVPSERRRQVRPVLVVIAGAELGRTLDLANGDVDIGRDEGASLRIDSDAVSRRHASIHKVGFSYLLADLGSTNGTFVNDKRIKGHTLAEGDQIRVGKVVLKYTENHIEAEYHEQLVRLATVDALTGAYNKRYFIEALPRIVKEARQAQTTLSMVVFDINHFKNINDTFGHTAGDHVLERLGDVVRAQVQSTDHFCRVGGEEFAVLLNDTSLQDARRAAEFVRGSIEMTDFVFDGKTIRVTVSLGAAALEAGETSDALYQRADERLYEAKRGGRNRVCA